ncbi:MAG: nucleotide sugar dehydrogenase, partial [Erysipelotrichaceae bacterium]|nr:nucleotide sugar dehydrogenase [Erysipelotrichaceae bacterium]
LEKDVVVVIKSTVPVGTNALVKRRFDQELVGKKAYVVSNPEFLAQGQAVNDALYPKRIVIGYEEPEVRKVMEEVYLPFSRQIVFTDLISSELSKYVCNNMLALKISFMNEIASLSDCVGADIECIKEIMQMDPRIGTSFLNPGIGYGGSCFPKDTIALSRFAKNELDLDLDIVNAGIKRNKLQKTILYRKAKERFGTLKGKNIALIGLTFKAGTDDLREAPSLVIIDALIKDGARVVAYDPLLDLINKKNINREVVFIKDFEEIVSSNDIIFLINDGLGLKPEMFTDKIVFDGRNNFKLDQVDVLKEYHSIGRKSIIN